MKLFYHSLCNSIHYNTSAKLETFYLASFMFDAINTMYTLGWFELQKTINLAKLFIKYIEYGLRMRMRQFLKSLYMLYKYIFFFKM